MLFFERAVGATEGALAASTGALVGSVGAIVAPAGACCFSLSCTQIASISSPRLIPRPVIVASILRTRALDLAATLRKFDLYEQLLYSLEAEWHAGEKSGAPFRQKG